MISIVGLGYVGLTLATAFAAKGTEVLVYDKNIELVENLRAGEISVEDINLKESFKLSQKNNKIFFSESIAECLNSSWIFICVGTPINSLNDVDENALMDVIYEIKNNMIHEVGELNLILRSTVKIGTSRNIYKVLKANSNNDVNVAFCPERTIEGNALNELFSLPQIISSYESKGLTEIKELFNKITPNVVIASSLEHAEAAKIYSNLWRDFKFSFSNSLFVNLYNKNINGHEVINLINEDYPRGGVPSPGFVGGPCLSKDVYMFNDINSEWTDLNFVARSRNERFIEWAAGLTIELYNQHKLSGPIGIVGGAFKGTPQTNDWRSSPALIIVKMLNEVFTNPPVVYDLFPPNVKQHLEKEKFSYTNSVLDLLDKCSLILIQNNNSNWLSEIFLETLRTWSKKLIIVDYWGMPKLHDVINPNIVKYSITSITRDSK